MKKKKIYLLILLLLNMIFIGKAKALDLKSTYIDPGDITGYGSIGLANYLTNVDFKNSFIETYTLNSKNDIKGYDYLQIGFLIQYNQTETYNETTNDYKPEENGELNCVTWELKNQTYADGTTSSYYLCTRWELINQSSLYTTSTNGTLMNTPNISIKIEVIYDNGTPTPCELNTSSYGDTVATCKIPDSANKIEAIKFFNTGDINYINTLKGRIGISNFYTIWKEPINTLKEQQQETNSKLDDIKNSDISNNSKEEPNTSEFNEYQNAEKGLFEKMEQADTSNLDIAIDGNSANFVWDTITRFYNSNALLMNYLISILSIGIIKMALGR